MYNNLVEYARGVHEDLERLRRMIMQDLKKVPETHREKVEQSLRIKTMLLKVQTLAQNLHHIYKDSDLSWKKEIDFLSGQGVEKDVYTIFYERFKDITSFYRKFPQLTEEITDIDSDDGKVPMEFIYPSFTGEEGFGRFLDLHVHHLLFTNSKFGSNCSYTEYIKEKVWAFKDLPSKYRATKEYISYISELLIYLESFYQRSKPLGSLDKIYSQINSALNIEWTQELKASNRKDRGSDHKNNEWDLAINDNNVLDLVSFSSCDELESIGTDRLKKALEHLGLKCGGKDKDRAQRLWKTRTIPLDQVNKRLFFTIKKSNEELRKTSINELKITKLSAELNIVLENTLANIEKKMTKTCEEIEQEMCDEDTPLVFADCENEENVCNPLKLPVGPDGKPIPYWLYKLHGLNQKIECEICGNYVYEGRRAFEKHFKEARHQRGMQALGIPNNRTFFEITKIHDAITLWNSVKAKQLNKDQNHLVQEFEDEDGNVYDKETYELLRKQGII